MKYRHPLGFDRWPQEAQVDWYSVSFTRAGLIGMILAAVGVEPSRRIGRDTKLRKDELARIHISLDKTTHESH